MLNVFVWNGLTLYSQTLWLFSSIQFVHDRTPNNSHPEGHSTRVQSPQATLDFLIVRNFADFFLVFLFCLIFSPNSSLASWSIRLVYEQEDTEKTAETRKVKQSLVVQCALFLRLLLVSEEIEKSNIHGQMQMLKTNICWKQTFISCWHATRSNSRAAVSERDPHGPEPAKHFSFVRSVFLAH